MNQTSFPNIEEKPSSVNNTNTLKRKMLYVVNFTPLRLFIFSVSSVVLFIFIFVLGFHLGGSKQQSGSISDEESRALLMREDGSVTASSSLIPGSLVESNLNTSPDISAPLTMQAMSQPGVSSEIVRENVEPNTNNYNEYTQSLALELNAMNETIRNQSDPKPNTTYTPPNQNAYTYTPQAEKPIAPREQTTITKTPYTSSVNANNVVYFIQVAVAYDKKNAYNAKDALVKRFPKSFIKEEASSDGTTMYKLKMGRYENRADAEKVLGEVRKIPAYKDSYIYTDKK